ncbi:MAG: helix-turn-helix domain-containing protein [Verrucomicrobiales bacterium]|nr:helix-turn-helix domain-containing protein [Verrucomicrobiales bacterium]
MASVGEQLKAAREAQRLSVHRVAEVTRMRTDQVLAIEAGNHAGFVAPVYLRGFVRAYARFVHLDEAEILSQLERDVGQPAREAEVTGRAGAEETGRDGLGRHLSGVRWQRVGPVLGGVLVALLGFVLLRSSGGGSRGAAGEGTPALYEPAGPDAGEVLALPEIPEAPGPG